MLIATAITLLFLLPSLMYLLIHSERVVEQAEQLWSWLADRANPKEASR